MLPSGENAAAIVDRGGGFIVGTAHASRGRDAASAQAASGGALAAWSAAARLTAGGPSVSRLRSRRRGGPGAEVDGL